ncbi:MAG: YqiA/YcfP family alpha/beta fold hydrolase [Thermoplasmatota archaeon]
MKQNKSPKIYYIHGYQSTPKGEKALLFKKKLKATPITYRDCSPEKLIISHCLTQISETISHDTNVLLIGSSLGGFLAAKTALENCCVKTLILLNPAIIPPETNLNIDSDVPKNILEDMKERKLFETQLSSNIIIIRGINDTVVPDEWIIKFAKAQQATVIFLDDDHRLSHHLKKLPTIIKFYINR